MLLFILSSLLMISTSTISACECGFEGASSRVFKGTKARANKYPWLAHIEVRPDGVAYFLQSHINYTYLQCGGSLIDETHVITAAHCVVDEKGKVKSPSTIDVFLGTVKARSIRVEPLTVSLVWADPKYDRELHERDFAILTLSEPVTYSQTVGPICLPNNESNLTKLMITGWGSTFDGADISDDLFEAEVDFINREECIERTLNYVIRMNALPESFKEEINLDDMPDPYFCAINKETHANVCEGDSGGPIMKKGTNGRYYLMGTASTLLGNCGEEADDVTAFYTRTFYYKDTIKSIAPNACWQD